MKNEPIIKRTFNNGVVQSDIVDEYVAPADTVDIAINMHFDKLGSVRTRPGTTRLGDAQIVNNKTVKGLFQFLDEGTGTADRLIAVVDTAAYYLSGTTWTSKRTGLTTDKKARFTSFLDSVFMVNNSEATAIWDGASGTSFITTGNAASAPLGKFIDNFKNRVFIANNNTYPSRVFYSSVPTTGTILWTGSDSSFIDIAPGDGEDVTAIKRFSKILWIFKNNFMYPLYSINQTEPDATIFVGTYSQESVDVAKDGMYWHHPSGIYRLRPGESQPKEISKPIYGIIKNVTLANYTETASWHDDDHVYTYVGNVTLDNGLVISNCVLRWTISTETWAVYSYPSPYVIGAQYNNGTSITRVVGDDDGYVYTFNSGALDNVSVSNTPIFYHLETHWMQLSAVRANRTLINQLAALHENATGAKLGYRTDLDSPNQVRPIGQLSDKLNTVFDNQNIKGHRIKIVLSGTSIGSPLTWQGFEILDYQNEGVTKD